MHRATMRRFAVACVLALLLAGCAAPPPAPHDGTGATAGSFALTSPAFADGERLPERFSCRGAGVAPPLAVAGLPPGAAALALVLDDPDAPRGLYTHWTAWDLRPNLSALPEDPNVTVLGGTEGSNTKGMVGYYGPCADRGEHRYVFHLHALDAPLGLPEGAAVADVRTALAAHSVAEATLTTRYGPV